MAEVLSSPPRKGHKGIILKEGKKKKTKRVDEPGGVPTIRSGELQKRTSLDVEEWSFVMLLLLLLLLLSKRIMAGACLLRGNQRLSSISISVSNLKIKN